MAGMVIKNSGGRRRPIRPTVNAAPPVLKVSMNSLQSATKRGKRVSMSPSIASRVAPIGVIARYREYLPVTEHTPVVSLGEGNTPLIPCPKLSARVGRGCEVFVKYEGLNPTCSFKDRG